MNNVQSDFAKSNQGIINGPHIMLRRSHLRLVQYISKEERGDLLLKIMEMAEGLPDTVGNLNGLTDDIFQNLVSELMEQDAKWTTNSESKQLKSKIMNEAKKAKALEKQRKLEELNAELEQTRRQTKSESATGPNHQTQKTTIKEPSRNHQGTIKEPNTMQYNPTQSNSTKPNSFSTQTKSQAVSNTPSRYDVADLKKQFEERIRYNKETVLPTLNQNNPEREKLIQSIKADEEALRKLEGEAKPTLEWQAKPPQDRACNEQYNTASADDADNEDAPF